MLTRRSLLQAAAAVLTGGPIAPRLIAADPVATEYGRLGRARYIFPLDLSFQAEKITWQDDGYVKHVFVVPPINPPKIEIPTLLSAHAPIAVVEVEYDFEFLWHGHPEKWGFKSQYTRRPCDLATGDTLHMTGTINEVIPDAQFTSGRVSVHGIVSKQDAPKALRLA